MPAEPTKLDHTLARKKSEAEAARYPLLARLGLSQTWTAQGQADQRAASRAAAKFANAQRLEREQEQLAAWRVELRQLLGPVVLRYIDWRLARSHFAHAGSQWIMWAGHIARARRGQAPIEGWTPQAAKRRAFVPPAAVRAVLDRRSGYTSYSAICDALETSGTHAHILDVSNAVQALRDVGDVEFGPRGGVRLHLPPVCTLRGF